MKMNENPTVSMENQRKCGKMMDVSMQFPWLHSYDPTYHRPHLSSFRTPDTCRETTVGPFAATKAGASAHHAAAFPITTHAVEQ